MATLVLALHSFDSHVFLPSLLSAVGSGNLQSVLVELSKHVVDAYH